MLKAPLSTLVFKSEMVTWFYFPFTVAHVNDTTIWFHQGGYAETTKPAWLSGGTNYYIFEIATGTFFKRVWSPWADGREHKWEKVELDPENQILAEIDKTIHYPIISPPPLKLKIVTFDERKTKIEETE
jgi:hypothetical protein